MTMWHSLGGPAIPALEGYHAEIEIDIAILPEHDRIRLALLGDDLDLDVLLSREAVASVRDRLAAALARGGSEAKAMSTNRAG